MIERWARATGVWTDNVDEVLPDLLGQQIAEGGEANVFDNGASLVKAIGLDYFILPILALDRISLHNAYFPESRMVVLGFGRTADGNFKVLVEQPFVQGVRPTDDDIRTYMTNLGFQLINPRNWTYATHDIYLSDMHDENVIKSENGNLFVIDCDIRINTPLLRCGGTRELTTEVELIDGRPTMEREKKP